MKIKKGMTCYYCGAEAASSEHVPPKCFFPKDKRNNLIQVPACELHNEDTSLDDSYVLFVIASFIGNNETGKSHSINKGIKTVTRSEALLSVIKENSIDVRVDGGNGVETTKMINIDRGRFDKEITKMAYALFYHTFGKRWERELNIGTNSLVYGNGAIDKMGELINKAKLFLSLNGIGESCPFMGDNQEIFKYRFIPTDNSDTPILQMVFYEGFEVWAFVRIEL